MGRLYHDGHTLGLQMLPDAVGHFGRQPLLHLQAIGKGMQHAGQLGNADHIVARQIGDMRLPHDRRHMMFAMRLKRNVLQQHDIVISAHLMENAREMIGGIVMIAPAIFAPGPRHTFRRLDQPFAFGRIARPADQRADRFRNLCRNRLLAFANHLRIGITCHEQGHSLSYRPRIWRLAPPMTRPFDGGGHKIAAVANRTKTEGRHT